MSLNVHDIPGETPKIWLQCANEHGNIHSNYGYLIYHPGNHNQYYNCLKTLQADKDSRRAIMIYTRPSIQLEYNNMGMSDFICTNTVQYFIRQNKLISLVSMRSNDAVFGFKNDVAWQKHVVQQLHDDLLETYPALEMGDMYWSAGSLHVYDRHFSFLEE